MKTTFGIHIDVEVDVVREDDGRFVARAPALRGATSSGETHAEALGNLRKIVATQLELPLGDFIAGRDQVDQVEAIAIAGVIPEADAADAVEAAGGCCDGRGVTFPPGTRALHDDRGRPVYILPAGEALVLIGEADGERVLDWLEDA